MHFYKVWPQLKNETNSTIMFISDNMNTVLIKQDPVMVANHKDEPPDPDTDFILQDSLPLFDNRLNYTENRPLFNMYH